MPVSVSFTLLAVLFLPFLSMLYVFLQGPFFRATAAITAFVILFFAIYAGLIVFESGSVRYSLGGWGAPLGIDLFLDGITSIMLILTATVGFFVTIYAQGYYSIDRETVSDSYYPSHFFWPLWFFTWGSLNALFLSADIFNIYVTLELMTFSAIAMITLSSTEEALFASGRYLFVTLLGSLAYLLGVGFLYSSYGALDIASLGEMIRSDRITLSAAALIISGMLIKSALFPMHFWLPAAHANAPSPVSAILSGLVITAPMYLLIRFWFMLFTHLPLEFVSQFLGFLGTIAIFWGSIQALRQSRLKMLVAYSTVAQIGYIFLLFPLATGSSEGQIFAWNGGILFALSHGCAKAAAFMAAGSILLELGHDRISDFYGLAKSSPVNVFVIALSGINLMGLPPSGGFIAKWLLLKAAMLSGQWWFAVIILIGGLITACYIFKVLEICLATAPVERISIPTNRMHYASLALALVSIFLGLGATLPLKILDAEQPASFLQQGESP